MSTHTAPAPVRRYTQTSWSSSLWRLDPNRPGSSTQVTVDDPDMLDAVREVVELDDRTAAYVNALDAQSSLAWVRDRRAATAADFLIVRPVSAEVTA